MEVSGWLREIDTVTETFRRDFGHLTCDEMNVQPSPGTWSIAQNLHHLIRINESYLPVISAAKAGTLKLSWLAKWDFIVSFFG